VTKLLTGNANFLSTDCCHPATADVRILQKLPFIPVMPHHWRSSTWQL